MELGPAIQQLDYTNGVRGSVDTRFPVAPGDGIGSGRGQSVKKRRVYEELHVVEGVQ